MSANTTDPVKLREKTIVKTSIIGIVANIFLASFKAAVGMLSNSIAVILDAVNNLSDALSSIITIVGAKIANKKPDRKHPMGLGRVEYVSAMLVSAIVLYAGVTSLVESVKKIISPEKPDYSAVSIIIIAVAVVVKIFLGLYVRKKGEEARSQALRDSGKDALFDAILSSSVLLSAIIFMIFDISLEAYVGVIISAFIIKAGIEMIRETLDDILGHRADPELTKKIKAILSKEEGVRGAYDLLITNYGPDRNYGSVHLELPDTMTVDEVDVLTRKAQARVYAETGVILTGVGVYSYNTSNDEAAKLRNDIQEFVLSHDWALQMHGFYLDVENKMVRFDVVVTFDSDEDCVEKLTAELENRYQDYHFYIAQDVDISD